MGKQAFLVIILTMLTVSGCDMFRSLAGRPTSADIRDRRMEILAYELSRDEMKARQKALSDSLATEDSLRQAQNDVRVLGGVPCSTELDSRYYIIVGTFVYQDNFEEMVRRVSAEGYVPTRIMLKNGMMAVGVCPVDTEKDLRYALTGVRKEDFCPPDVWVLSNKQL